jgi:hypothetical protein
MEQKTKGFFPPDVDISQVSIRAVEIKRC